MPSYSPTVWTNDSLPAIDAENLNNIENWNVLVASGGRTGIQAGTLASEHAGLPIGVQLPLNATLIWADSNMGPGSGLDADKLDGQHGSYFMPITGTGGPVSFTGAVTFSSTTTVTVAGSMVVNGSLTVSGGGSIAVTSITVTNTCTAGAFNVGSTRAIKDNIHPLICNATEILNAIPVYTYTLKSDPRKDYHTGLMVEDTPTCFVNPDASGIDVYALVSYLVKANQELNARLEALERK